MRPFTVHTSCPCLHADTRSVVLNGHDLLNLALRVTLGTLTVDEVKLGGEVNNVRCNRAQEHLHPWSQPYGQ